MTAGIAPARTFAQTLRAGARGAGLVGWTAAMLGAAEVHKRADRALTGGACQEQIFDAYMRRWTAGGLRLVNVDLRLISGPPAPAPAGRGRLVVSNHRSAVDIPILLTHFGGSVLSHIGVQSWPLLGTAARRAQTIFVDRESRHSGAQAIREIRAQLRRGRCVSVFPEGTTFVGDEVRPFNAGAFAAARGLDIEVVPVGLAYPPGCEFDEPTFLDHAKSVAGRPRTPVAVVIGAARSLQGRSTAMAAELQAEVQALVARARAAL